MQITGRQLRRIIREELLREEEEAPVNIYSIEFPDDLLGDWSKYNDLVSAWLEGEDADLTYDEYVNADNNPGDRSFDQLKIDTSSFMRQIGIDPYNNEQTDAFYARLAQELGDPDMFSDELDGKAEMKNDAILKRRNSAGQKSQDQKPGSSAVRPNVFPDRGPPLELDWEKSGWSVNDPFPDFSQKNR
jgi:hypothetical protein